MIGAKDFPKLETNLSPGKKEKLMIRLKVDSDRIIKKFGSLLSKTEKALENSNKHVTADNLKSFLENCSYQKVSESIKPSDTIPMVMRKIKKAQCWSFFDFELLESLIETYCKEEIAADYQQYVADFNDYCKRRLYEVPKSAFSSADDSTNFVVKLDKKFDVPLNYIKEVELKLSKILGLELKLKKVKQGCIELTFGQFSTENIVIGVSKQKTVYLKELQIEWLHYDQLELYNRRSCDYHHNSEVPQYKVCTTFAL